ncbi:Retrovirus-related Pol polyprotein from transposon TNT 1-94 [Cucumis melo var. makuwa]|uniref:Retrovirus-related Pol polyprotein from transposon TNT 1-94 n=1 Tax=Cucumis melo var. makuwa TaxID=1194695 RepID=A0A5D3BBJ0_CUCMM|nr:Retrovirus-related Pol polyprotein from transposon TNT 1-94 [Cucumis melo var. makuwa]
MTSNYSLMNTPSPAKSLPPIYAADGNCMNITHIGIINTPVQDPQIGQTIRTGRKVGRLFELLSLQVPPPSSISAPVTNSNTYQWHLRLDHASPEKLHHLISINNLNNITKALLFSALAPTLLKKMDVLSVKGILVQVFNAHFYDVFNNLFSLSRFIKPFSQEREGRLRHTASLSADFEFRTADLLIELNKCRTIGLRSYDCDKWYQSQIG